MFTQTEKYGKVESVNTKNDYETASKRWTHKRETDSFPIKQIQNCSKEFIGNKNNVNKKKISWKSYRPQWHYMISMNGQKPKIGGNWPLAGPYLQRW